MSIITNTFQKIIWTIINLFYIFIDTIYSSFVKLNGINIINDLLMKDSTLTKAYNVIIVLAIVILGFFAIWNYIKKFLEPDDTPTTSQITLEVVKCTVMVVLSSFLLTQIFNFSVIFSGALGNLFKSDNYSFSSSIVSSYIEINPEFQNGYESGAISRELNFFNIEKENNIKGYINKIKELNTELNKYSSTTGIKYQFVEAINRCTTSKVTKEETKLKENSTKDTDKMISSGDKNTNTPTQSTVSLQDKITAREEACQNLKKEEEREFEGKSSKFPRTPNKDPFASNGVDVKDKNSVQSFINNSFKSENYESSNWYQNEMWSWYYVLEDGTLGIDALDDVVLCWGGNTALLLLVGGFLVYAMFFSGIMLARRQLEMLLMFFFSPIIFACSICNKQRRQSLYEQLSSLAVQSAAVMMVLGIGAILISKITSLDLGTGTDALLIKSFLVCAVATLILTGSEVVNRFIGANLASNNGRAALQSMAGFNAAAKGVATSGGLAAIGTGITAMKIGRHPVSTAKGVGSFAKNGVLGAVNSAVGTVNSAKGIKTGLDAKSLEKSAFKNNDMGALEKAIDLGEKSKEFKSKAQSSKEKARINKTNVNNILQTAKKQLPTNMTNYRRRYPRRF